jgi:hypothetical protein
MDALPAPWRHKCMFPAQHMTMREIAELEEAANEAILERRREKRLPLSFPIEVSGFDCHGRFFKELTVTTDVSPNGCSFHLRTEPDRTVELAVKLISRNSAETLPDRPLLFHLVRMDATPDGWLMAAIKVQTEDLWYAAFPPARRHPTPVA